MNEFLLNGKQLRKKLHIGTTLFYNLREAGMPYHKLPGGRAYYNLEEIKNWLSEAGYDKKKIKSS